jgi:hypothetical protein
MKNIITIFSKLQRLDYYNLGFYILACAVTLKILLPFFLGTIILLSERSSIQTFLAGWFFYCLAIIFCNMFVAPRKQRFFLKIFVTAYSFIYFILLQKIHVPFEDAVYYLETAKQISSVDAGIEWAIENVKSIRLPSIGFNFITAILLPLVDYSVWVLAYGYLVFYWGAVCWLSRIKELIFLPRIYFVLLFISPTVLWLALPLLKETINLALLIFSIGAFYKRNYASLLFLAILVTTVRVYSVFALASSLIFFSYYYARQSGKSLSSPRILGLTTMSFVFLFSAFLDRIPNVYQMSLAFPAILFTPAPWNISNYFSSSLVFIQTIESLLFLLALVALIFYYLLKVSRGIIPFRPVSLTLDFALIISPVIFIMSSEATSILEVVQYSGEGVGLGDQYNRKKTILIPIIYLYAILLWQSFFCQHRKLIV